MDPLHERLLTAARAARASAYCPYSGFAVGAAVLTDDGRVHGGSNVENASFGLTVCAERAAILAAVTSGARRLQALAVACPTDKLDVTARAPSGGLMPCGACRQVMTEFMRPDAIVIVDGAGVFSLAELIPHAFTLLNGTEDSA